MTDSVRKQARAFKARAARLRRVYGITIVQYQAMDRLQEHRCKICARSFDTRRAYVDHDHKTGRVRGLLCFTCNRYKVAKNDFLSAQLVAAYLGSDFDGRHILLTR